MSDYDLIIIGGGDIQNVAHVFPTLSENVRKTAQGFEMNLEEWSCCVE